MADNILKGIIVLEAKGVAQTTSQVATAIGKTETSLKKLTPASNQATNALTNLSRVAQDAPYGFIGIANNLNPLLESFQRLKAETGSTKTALSALGTSLTGAGGIGLALGVASSLLVVFQDKLFGTSKAAKEAKSSADELKDAISNSFKEAGREASEVNGLIAVLKSEAETRERKLAAIKELQRIQPEIFSNLKLEGSAVTGLDTAYKAYISNLRSVIQADILRARLSQLITKQLELEGATATGKSKEVFEANRRLIDQAQSGKLGTNALTETLKISSDKKDKAAQQLAKDIQDIFSQLEEVSKGVKLTIPKPKVEGFKDLYEDPFKGGKLDFNFREPIRLAEMAARELRESVKKELEQPIKPRVNIKLIKPGDGLLDEDLKDMNDGLTASINEFLASSAIEGLSTIGEAIGAALSGGDLKGVFNGFANAIAGGLQALGKQFIKFGAIALLAKKALKTLFQNPFAAIAAGVALVAAGSALKGALGKGLTGARAMGGPVGSGGSYLVGERGPEIFTPSMNGSIIPNSRLGSYGGGSLAGQVQFVISGNNLIGVMSAAGRNQRRLV